jgi:predicted aconitase with swiveling domain
MGDKVHLRGRAVTKGKAEGKALVAKEGLSFWGGVDAVTGKVIAAGHPLEGVDISGKVLVIPSTKGSSGTPMMMEIARHEGNLPAAMINTEVDSLAALGCIVNNIPLVADLEQDPFSVIETGDYVVVDGDAGEVTITKKG